MSEEKLCFDRARFEAILDVIESMAVGDLERQIPLTRERDELDALSHGVNVLSSELRYRLRELQTAQITLIQSGKLAALGEVSSGLAHELNNPLTIVAGYLEHIHTAIKNAAVFPIDFVEVESHFQKVERNLDRMNVIIRHIMEFARESEPVKEPVMLHEVIQKSFTLISEQLRLKKIQVETDLCSTLIAEINTSKMEQVFINLLSNARDAIVEAHGDEGGKIRIVSRMVSDSELEIEISDNGIGMTEETRSKIFNPFFTTKEVGQGTGLGLSISHGIVQDHGGKITCVSERAKGTAFHIRLPRYHSRETTAIV
jgi:signal transduction histidine kinase